MALFLALASTLASAQQSVTAPQPGPTTAPLADPAQLPSAPEPAGTLSTVILDPSGAGVSNATVILEDTLSHRKLTASTDSDGTFTFTAVPPGSYILSIAAPGFAPWRTPGILVHPDESAPLSPITLALASVDSSVEAITQEQLADQQIKVEETQRVLGVIPNFYVSYVWNAAPLTVKQKYALALRATYDPATFVIAGVGAGIEQATDTYNGFSQGASGYAKRYAANYGDALFGNFFGGAVFPSLLHQDPRYFYKGTGSIRSRALYAISTVVICKGDNGRWQPNYSSVLGDFAAAGLANYYYPATNRDSAGLFVDNVLIGTAAGAGSALIQEFIVRRFTRHPPPAVPAAPNPTP